MWAQPGFPSPWPPPLWPPQPGTAGLDANAWQSQSPSNPLSGQPPPGDWTMGPPATPMQADVQYQPEAQQTVNGLGFDPATGQPLDPWSHPGPSQPAATSSSPTADAWASWQRISSPAATIPTDTGHPTMTGTAQGGAPFVPSRSSHGSAVPLGVSPTATPPLIGQAHVVPGLAFSQLGNPAIGTFPTTAVHATVVGNVVPQLYPAASPVGKQDRPFPPRRIPAGRGPRLYIPLLHQL